VSAVAAGNEGFTDSLSVPACASKAVSVGAVFPSDVPGNVGWAMGCNQVSPKRDTVVCFTNRWGEGNDAPCGYASCHHLQPP
jgi:hypothetical protein